MAYQSHPMTSKTTTLSHQYQQRTLVLRSQVDAMHANVERKVDQKTEQIKERFKNASEEQVDSLIHNAFEEVRIEVSAHLTAMETEVKSHAPKKPVRLPDQSEEDHQKNKKQFEQDWDEYLTFVGYVTNFLKGLSKLFADICMKIKEFFRSLWNWIKQKLQDISKKVTDFMCFLKNTISRGLATLF